MTSTPNVNTVELARTVRALLSLDDNDRRLTVEWGGLWGQPAAPKERTKKPALFVLYRDIRRDPLVFTYCAWSPDRGAFDEEECASAAALAVVTWLEDRGLREERG